MQSETACTQSSAPQTITGDAERTWRDNPHLHLVFADFGAFLQANLQMRREHLEQIRESNSSNTDIQDHERSLALSRLNLIRNPQGTG